MDQVCFFGSVLHVLAAKMALANRGRVHYGIISDEGHVGNHARLFTGVYGRGNLAVWGPPVVPR